MWVWGVAVLVGWVRYRGSKGSSLGCCIGGEGIKGARVLGEYQGYQGLGMLGVCKFGE